MRQPGMVQTFEVPFVGQQAMPILEWLDQVREQRTGISKSALGRDPKALQSTTQIAAAATVTGAQAQVELFARIFAETGMKRMFRGILRLLVQNQRVPLDVVISGEPVSIDPRKWDVDAEVVVNTALGTGANDQKLQTLQMVAANQTLALDKLGLDNPLCSLEHLYNTQVRLLELSGMRHNNLGREVDLHGFVFTDGDNIFTFPAGSTVSPDGNLRIAASKDEGDIREPVDLYWGDWGLSEDGELVMLINDEGDMVLDFVFVQPLEEGELLERIPTGTAPLMDSVKSQPMQMQRPSYRAVPAEAIDGLGQDFSTSVLSVGGLLTGISTFLINLDQAREILDRFGISGKRREENRNRPGSCTRFARGGFSYSYNRPINQAMSS